MTRFVVYVHEVHVQPILIEAPSKEEALNRVIDGDGTICEGLVYSHTLDPDTWTVGLQSASLYDPFYVPPIDAPPEPDWSFAKRGDDAVCPCCGSNGLAHVTIFRGQPSVIGRQCKCGAEWPIYIRPVEECP